MPHDGAVSSRSFSGQQGGREHFITISPPPALDFRAQIAFVEDHYRDILQRLGLDRDSAVFRRLFHSDIINQAAAVRDSTLVDDRTAVSMVQQPPLDGAKLALLAYHIDDGAPVAKTWLGPRHLLVEKNGARHLWSTRLCCCDRVMAIDSDKQTREIFRDLIDTLAAHGATLRDNCARTWLYMKGVDVFYKGMVDARRELFDRHGLTSATHYIASTGIEGACSHRYDLVSMDAYSHLDLKPEQVSYLNDFDRLCPTHQYNVTFERGTRIAYADRAHHFISGTASIDNAGEVVHPGDILKQLDRTLENVEALLRSGGAGLADLMHMIVYLRDPADYHPVAACLNDRLPDVPAVIVLGAVCRPAWLVEIEGIAVAKHDNPALPSF